MARPRLLRDYVDLLFSSFYEVFKLSLIITVAVALSMDFYTKYQSEVKVHQRDLSACSKDFYENKCDEPVPAIREYCAQKERCMMEN